MVQAGFVDIISVGRLPVLCLFDEKSEESACLVNVSSIPHELSYEQ